MGPNPTLSATLQSFRFNHLATRSGFWRATFSGLASIFASSTRESRPVLASAFEPMATRVLRAPTARSNKLRMPLEGRWSTPFDRPVVSRIFTLERFLEIAYQVVPSVVRLNRHGTKVGACTDFSRASRGGNGFTRNTKANRRGPDVACSERRSASAFPISTHSSLILRS